MNHLVVSGINLQSTPIAIREQFSIPASCLKHALTALSSMPHIKEAVLLSTCNRTEVYAVVSDVQAGLREIDSFFMSTRGVVDHEILRPNFKLLREDAALQLFRVASGLSSMVLGESQIMHQVKAAHQAALEAGCAKSFLDQLFKMALNCGKRVRTETSLSKRAVSVSSAALELAHEIIEQLKDRTIAIIGAGRMAQICIKHILNESGQGPVFLLNRSDERINQFLKNNLPNKHRLQTGFSFADKHKIVANADLVIVATSAHDYIIRKNELAELKISGQTKIIDISVPRNVEPSCAEIEGISLYNSDDLSSIVNKNLAERELLTEEAETIIMETLETFEAWQRSLLVVPTIAELRQKIEAIRLEQVQKSNSLCGDGASENIGERLEEISRAIVNQILHHPTVQLKATRDYENLRQQAEALTTLFNLDPIATNQSNYKRKIQATCQSKDKLFV